MDLNDKTKFTITLHDILKILMIAVPALISITVAYMNLKGQLATVIDKTASIDNRLLTIETFILKNKLSEK